MTTPLMVLLTLACNGGDGDLTGPSTPNPGGTLAAEDYDVDEDGHTAATDCDDFDASVNPDADELCDNIDNNCDGSVDEDSATDARDWYLDEDDDGFGAGDAVPACDEPDNHVISDEDCDDTDAGVNPSASEICDGVDNDCDEGKEDGGTDEANDEDDDGFDDVCGADCDDGDAAINTDAVEVCDGADNDCDGNIDGADAAEAISFWLDDDGDGYGDAGTEVLACPDDAPALHVNNSDDCDDANADRNPGATEVCDGTVDEDCDLEIDEGLSATYYADSDGDGFGADASGASYCDDPGSGYTTAGGDCDETDTAVNPDGTEVCNDWVDNDCDGTDNGCSPSGTWTADAADVTVLADASSGWLGWSLASGDVTGDGTLDVLCGAPEADETSADSGGAYVFSGATSGGDVTDADSALLYDATTSAYAGRSLAVGDLDDDGQDDVVMGAYGDNGVVVFLGPVGASPSYDAIITDDSGDDTAFGIQVAVGDLDGDGHDDLAIGASSHSNTAGGGSGDDGAVFVYYGPLADVILAETDADAVFEAPAGGSQAGGWLSFTGDVLGTGSETLAIGARRDDAIATDSGTVYLVTGAHSGTVDLESADAIVQGGANSDQLWHAAGGDDLDGDGNDDLILGAYVADDAVTNGGALYVFYGPLAGTLSSTDNDFAVYGDVGGGGLGYDVASAGDVNGDGEIDLLAGAPYKDTTGASPGTAYLFYGPFTGDVNSTDADLTVGAGAGSDFLGGAVLGVGDLNADGYDDFAFGDYAEDSVVSDGGACYVIYGGGI